jgi:hypothetical protein
MCVTGWVNIPPTTLADFLGREQVMDIAAHRARIDKILTEGGFQ